MGTPGQPEPPSPVTTIDSPPSVSAVPPSFDPPEPAAVVLPLLPVDPPPPELLEPPPVEPPDPPLAVEALDPPVPFGTPEPLEFPAEVLEPPVVPLELEAVVPLDEPPPDVPAAAPEELSGAGAFDPSPGAAVPLLLHAKKGTARTRPQTTEDDRRTNRNTIEGGFSIRWVQYPHLSLMAQRFPRQETIRMPAPLW